MAKKKVTSKKRGNSIVGKIARKSKQIRKKGEKWTNAIKRAVEIQGNRI